MHDVRTLPICSPYRIGSSAASSAASSPSRISSYVFFTPGAAQIVVTASDSDDASTSDAINITVRAFNEPDHV